MLGIGLEHCSVDQMWEQLTAIMNEHPDPIHCIQCIYEFQFTDGAQSTCQLILNDGQAIVVPGKAHKTECRISIAIHDFKKLLLGDFSSTTAYMTGKIKVEGSLGLALRLETILKKYRMKEHLN